ncbi:hypothetical protein O3M35_009723 [Rhynocoris fuscipes]|uniref:palmitoyl-protein hydrolase n=1 Tax=Rhynocoris fuscipes TaxID=488301 RepID=A0AAW1D7K6_9HEMI
MEIIKQKQDTATGCLIFLHGLGKTGEWQKQQFFDLMRENTRFPHIKMIFPTSRYVHCSHKNSKTYSWFDFKAAPDHSRDTFQVFPETLNETFEYIDKLVKTEIESGISPDRIIIGGVSQGAVVSLLYGYARDTNIKGVISLSGFYPKIYEDKFRTDDNLPPLFFANFDGDRIIPYYTIKGSAEFLSTKPIVMESHLYHADSHEINKEMLTDTYKWIEKNLK